MLPQKGFWRVKRGEIRFQQLRNQNRKKLARTLNLSVFDVACRVHPHIVSTEQNKATGIFGKVRTSHRDSRTAKYAGLGLMVDSISCIVLQFAFHASLVLRFRRCNICRSCRIARSTGSINWEPIVKLLGMVCLETWDGAAYAPVETTNDEKTNANKMATLNRFFIFHSPCLNLNMDVGFHLFCNRDEF